MKKLDIPCDKRTFRRISAMITIESTFVFNTILFTSMLHNAMSIYGSLSSRLFHQCSAMFQSTSLVKLFVYIFAQRVSGAAWYKD